MVLKINQSKFEKNKNKANLYDNKFFSYLFIFNRFFINIC